MMFVYTNADKLQQAKRMEQIYSVVQDNRREDRSVEPSVKK